MEGTSVAEKVGGQERVVYSLVVLLQDSYPKNAVKYPNQILCKAPVVASGDPRRARRTTWEVWLSRRHRGE